MRCHYALSSAVVKGQGFV